MRAEWVKSIQMFVMALFATAFTCVGSYAIAKDAPDITNPDVVEAFVDGVVKPTMKSSKSPSGVVMVMKGGQILFSKGYGFQDVEKRIPVNPETTLFRPGSISKLFTWVSVMQLVEQGQLNLDVDVNTYLKRFQVKASWPGQPITLRHIMTHTPGFEVGGLGYLIIDDLDRILPLHEALERYQPERVNPPGKYSAYSNWGTALAGLIVSNVSGMSYNDYVRTHIFEVLGMSSSTFQEPLPPELERQMAKAYGYSGGRYVEQNYEFISNFGPAGALAATAHDMALFAKALLNGGAIGNRRILKPETLDKILSEGFSHDPRVRAIGLGFLKRRYGPDDLENFGHDGGTTIFLSHFGLSLKEDLMLFTSFSGPGARSTHDTFVKAFYDQFFPRELPVLQPPEDFKERAQNYAGTYVSRRASFTKIEAISRAFSSVQVTPLPDSTLMVGPNRYVEVERNLFQEVDDYGRIAFQEDTEGNITGYVIDGVGVMQFYKAPFYESAGFISLSLGACIFVFATIYLRLIYRWREFRHSTGLEKKALSASLMVATSNVLFFIFMAVGISRGVQALTYKLPDVIIFSLAFPVLATVSALYHLYITSLVWRTGALSGIGARFRLSAVCVCSIFLVWFYGYWNFLGLNYLR